MPELITRTARLVPYAKRPKQVPSFVTAYSYEPMPDESAARLGGLFVVLEVLVNGRSSEEVADLIIETLGTHYYNGEVTDTTEPLHRFENAIKAVNRELTEYVNQGNAAWIGKLSAVVAVQAGHELHLSQTGSAEAFLYRGKTAARINGHAPARAAVPSKTFGSIASGGLEPSDRLLLATPALIHQVSLGKLKGIVSETGPNSAIAEITDLLRGSSSERIAALVIEVTTPELAALQVRSDEPNEIQLGGPENVLEAAKLAATPLAQATVTSSRRAGEAATRSWERLRPHAHRLGLASVDAMRRFLTGPGARRRLLIVAAILMIGGGGFWWWSGSTARTNELLTRYKIDYHQYQLAELATSDGDRAGARDLLGRLQAELGDLAKTPGRTSLDHKLTQAVLPEGAPTTVAAFTKLVSAKLDEIEGLKHATVTTVANFTGLKNSLPSHMEVTATKAYLFDSHNDSAIYIVNLTTNDLKKSAADTAKLGAVVATTLASTGDGIYILTNKPSVWFYRFDSDSLTEQVISLGQWPVAKAIASYSGNLYLLGDGVIYKHLRTYSGFSPKTEYLTSAQSPGLAGATGLAVDGSVYAISASGLRLYLAGTLKATAEVPGSLAAGTGLRSTNNGDTLIATSSTGQRVGFWNNTSNLVFDQQYALNGVKTIYDAAYDGKTKTAYALVDSRLVKFTR